MEYTAGNVHKAIDMLAPFKGGCMAWDNVGLLVGSRIQRSPAFW